MDVSTGSSHGYYWTTTILATHADGTPSLQKTDVFDENDQSWVSTTVSGDGWDYTESIFGPDQLGYDYGDSNYAFRRMIFHPDHVRDEKHAEYATTEAIDTYNDGRIVLTKYSKGRPVYQLDMPSDNETILRHFPEDVPYNGEKNLPDADLVISRHADGSITVTDHDDERLNQLSTTVSGSLFVLIDSDTVGKEVQLFSDGGVKINRDTDNDSLSISRDFRGTSVTEKAGNETHTHIWRPNGVVEKESTISGETERVVIQPDGRIHYIKETAQGKLDAHTDERGHITPQISYTPKSAEAEFRGNAVSLGLIAKAAIGALHLFRRALDHFRSEKSSEKVFRDELSELGRIPFLGNKLGKL